MEYVTAPSGDGACFICRGAGSSEDVANLILARGMACLVIMNSYPYNTGHLMVAPIRHAGELEELTREEQLEVMDLIIHAKGALKKALQPHGFNIGANLGAAAGAGVPGHLHVHVVPRWNGDTNFMPVLSDSKVIPEPLADTYKRIKEYF
jgi:ATP adenylyltransferase